MTAEQLAQARAWLIECASCGIFRDVDADDAQEFIAELTESQVLRAVARHFDGGIAAFIAS